MGALSVRGNHDDSGLAAYEAIQRGEKVKGKHKWAHKLSAGDAEWLALLPWSLSIPSYNLLVVHAGVVPEVCIPFLLCPRPSIMNAPAFYLPSMTEQHALEVLS